jgi:hypothetical protein
LIGLLIFLLSACKKSNSSTSQPPTTPPVPAIEYFPNTLNDRWVYDFTDSIDPVNVKTQTVTVTISATVSWSESNGQILTGKQWDYKYSNNDTIDSKVAFISNNYAYKTANKFGFNNSLSINADQISIEIPDSKYALPLTTDSYIFGSLHFDTTNVQFLGNLKIKDQAYDSGYVITTKELGYISFPDIPEYFEATEWFVPHVGTVKLNYKVFTNSYIIRNYAIELTSKKLF